MIAGSDTTSTTLAAALFYLVRNPHAMALLKKEVREAFSSVEEIVTGARLNELVYLPQFRRFFDIVPILT